MRKKSYLTLWLIVFVFLLLPSGFNLGEFGWADVALVFVCLMFPAGAAMEAGMVEKDFEAGTAGLDLESVRW